MGRQQRKIAYEEDNNDRHFNDGNYIINATL